MKEVSQQDKAIINEWEKRQEKYEEAKKELRDVLGKYGVASSEFNAARVDFEMLKEEFDNFEKENHSILSGHR